MPKHQYIEKKFAQTSIDVIEHANQIIDTYLQQGYKLTLRQVYYQFVARGLLPENTMQQYKRLGSIINDARLAGLIDWDAIEDRTRSLRSNSHWDSPGDIVDACARQFQYDKWLSQEYRPEVFIEKDALVGVIEGVCRELDVSYFSCRGYTSQSEMWAAGQRLLGYIDKGQTPVVLHLGDHDPSGIDMSRDIRDRLKLFVGDDIEVKRLALNFDPVQQYSPPPNFAKQDDSRYKSYKADYGEESWELDALEPSVLTDLIQDAVQELRDDEKWEEEVAKEEEARQRLKDIASELSEE